MSVVGSLNSVSYSARLPKTTRPVAGTNRSGMYTRGPIAAEMPTSPGTLSSDPVMTNLADAERQRVAELRVERDEQRGIDDGVRAVLKLPPRGDGIGDDVAVERIARAHGVHLHEPRAAAPRHQRHRRESGGRHVGDAGAREGIESESIGRRARRIVARAATSPPSSARDCSCTERIDVLGERVDRDERRDAERDRRHVEQKPPARRAALAPGEGEAAVASPSHSGRARSVCESEMTRPSLKPNDPLRVRRERVVVRDEHDRRRRTRG